MFARLAGSVRQRISLSIQSRIDSTKQRISAKFSLPEKYKGTIVENWSRYWSQLFIDYGEVIGGVGTTIRTKPIKSAFYAATGTGLYFCAKNNPSPVDFMIQLRNLNGDLLVVDPKCHNPESAEYLKFLERSLNRGLIRNLNLGVCSLMWLADYDQQLSLFKATCSYTGIEYSKFPDRVIDVGFWGRWWNLHNKMIDYDVVDNA